MRPSIAVGFKACCFTVGLMLANVQAADSAPSLKGLTREQVIERLGEPRSAIVAAGREILFYDRERLVLRDGVVIEIEALPVEPPRRPAPPRTAPKDEVAAEEPAADEAPRRPRASRDEPEEKAEEKPEAESSTEEAAPVRPPEPSLSIKSVRPPTGTYTRPPPKKQEPAAAPAQKSTPTPTSPAAAPRAATKSTAPTVTPAAPVVPSAPSVAAPGSGLPSAAPAATAAASGATSPAAETSSPTAAPDEALAHQPAVDPAEQAPAAPKKAKSAARKAGSESDEFAETTGQIFTTQTYLITAIIIGAGVGYLVWRRRQRELELAATAVSRTPFEAPKNSGTGARFTAEVLGKLEWKKFEDLVAAYYNKTGVVAVRTKSGPKGPVHIRISWKGESRPFACVQCLSHVTGLIDVKPLQELVTVLAAEDIRRGYVVTTGKFGVAARDFAEEKHITLMPGDIFLEKLNALPDAARAEVMQEVMTGDLTTPSCPKCEARMVRSPDDPSVWRCATHPDQTIAGR